MLNAYNCPICRRRNLKKFLNQTRCQTTEEVLATLEPFFRRPKTKNAPAENLDKAEIARLVTLVTNQKVDEVVFASLAESLTSVACRQIGIHKTIDLGGTVEFGQSFYYALQDNFHESFRDGFLTSIKISSWNGPDRLPRTRTEMNMNEAFYRNFMDLAEAAVSSSIALAYDLNYTACYYIGFSVINNREQAEKLKLLLVLLSKIHMIGFLDDRPEVVFVVTD